MVCLPTYSRSDLLQLGNTKTRLPNLVWRKIAALGISVAPPTHRGKRAGRRKQRKIEVVTTRRPCNFTPSTSGERVSYLRPIPASKPIQQTRMALWNARSIRNKTTTTGEFVLQHKVEALFLTETWQKSEDEVVIGELTPPGYTYLSCPRPGDAHGGLGVLHKSSLNFQNKDIGLKATTFEHLCILDTDNGVRYILIYRPPPSTENGFKTRQFLEEFDDFLDAILLLPGRLVILGDFNVHVDVPEKTDSNHLLTSISSAGLLQHVTEPTHKKGHTLDLLMSRADDDIIHHHEVCNLEMSDHYIIFIDVNQRRSSVSEEVTTTRCYRDLDVQNFTSNLEVEFRDFPYDGDVNRQVDFYIKKSRMVFDISCSESTKKKKTRQHFPWYTSEVRNVRKAKRRSERRWRKTRSESDREIYLEMKKNTDQVIEAAKASYYKTKLKDADSKTVYSTINALLNKKPEDSTNW